jgi:vancomycin resistance protein YoaR
MANAKNSNPVEPEFTPSRRGRAVVAGVIAAPIIALLLIVGFQLLYVGKVYPGVRANGVYLGGLSQTAATTNVTQATAQYQQAQIPVTYGTTTLRIDARQVAPTYDATAITTAAYQYGRTGSWPTRLHEQLRALFGRATSIGLVSYDPAKLTPYLSQIIDDTAKPVSNASFTFEDGTVAIAPAATGQRVDIGALTTAIKNRLAYLSEATIDAPVYTLAPAHETAALEAVKPTVEQYASSPLTLKTGSSSQNIDQKTIISWMQLGYARPSEIITDYAITDFYHQTDTVSIGLDDKRVTAYVAGLATKVNRTAQNAALSITDGKATVFQPSHDGAQLDQAGTVSAIQDAVAKTGGDRVAVAPIKIVKADVSEDSLNNLGINELISEGVTYFPGSPSTRLTNVRTGASKFNGVLLKPGEVFSFGAILGDVGPEQGYVPELVILGDHEEKQYGGGLCQVSSTAYRAALLAGLPIVERHNHSFAISYYTNPYGVPGVDATIYYPAVDFKFRNDTGSYILIQTQMTGTTLKFDYYGTKTKSGAIRGPFFVTGNNDATQPSHTVFYRDVLDLAGNVTKTDTVDTYYKSSKDFPIQKQFN